MTLVECIGSNTRSLYLETIQATTLDALFNLLNYSRTAVKKRCLTALTALTLSIGKELHCLSIQTILNLITDKNVKRNNETIRIYLACLKTLW